MGWSKKQLNYISEELVKRIDDIYRHFGIEYIELSKMIRSSCYIHGGDNITALNCYHKADMACHYKCRTHGCEEVFGKSIIGMVRGFLSHQKYGWCKRGDKEVSFPEAVSFIINFLDNKQELLNIQDNGYNNKSDFNYIISHLTIEESSHSLISREDIRKKLAIPSKYFVQRGFSQEVLDTYDVGECKDNTKYMKYRAVVPIYDIDYHYIGATGRSIFEKCDKCKGFHHPNSKCMKISKWKHSKGLNRNLCLYNLHKSKSSIMKSHVVVVVESPSNVWRLEESGIHNSVAIFGTTIHETQRYLLDDLGVMAMIIIMDNDGAGETAKENIKKIFSKLYRLYFPTISTNDVAELSVNSVKENLRPFVENIMEIYS